MYGWVCAGGRRVAVARDQSQLQIDAGQERGPTLCLTCGTVYSKGIYRTSPHVRAPEVLVAVLYS